MLGGNGGGWAEDAQRWRNLAGWGVGFLEGYRELKGTLESIEGRGDAVRFGCFHRSLWLLQEGSWEGGERLCVAGKGLSGSCQAHYPSLIPYALRSFLCFPAAWQGYLPVLG